MARNQDVSCYMEVGRRHERYVQWSGGRVKPGKRLYRLSQDSTEEIFTKDVWCVHITTDFSDVDVAG